MAMFFFDFRSGDVISLDEEGQNLPDVEAAHSEAMAALSDVISDFVMQGQSGQAMAIEVRDDLGPVLEVTAVFGSKILRKQ